MTSQALNRPVDVLGKLATMALHHGDAWVEVHDAVAELIDAAERANKLIGLLTVRQVIEGGDEAIDAAGLNPWCINEGLADGSEAIGFWRLGHALAAIGSQP